MNNEVEIIGEEEKMEKVGVGSLWKEEKTRDVYLLTIGDDINRVCLARLGGIGCGRRFRSRTIEIAVTSNLTGREWDDVKHGYTFTRITQPIKITPGS